MQVLINGKAESVTTENAKYYPKGKRSTPLPAKVNGEVTVIHGTKGKGKDGIEREYIHLTINGKYAWLKVASFESFKDAEITNPKTEEPTEA